MLEGSFEIGYPFGPSLLNEIKKHSGRQFDPKVVEAFLKIIARKDVRKMLKKEIYGSEKARK